MKLHTKFLVLVLGSLALFLSTLSFLIIQREARLLEKKSGETQRILADAVAADLKDSMMTNRPRGTRAMIKSLQGAYGLVRLDVLRRDGSPAFEVAGKPVAIPQLEQVFTTADEVRFREAGDLPSQTFLIPLKNNQDCRICHAQDAAVLGAVVITLSQEDTIREIAASKRNLTTLLTVIMVLIGSVLYGVIRMVVLKPLALLHDGANRIGEGDFTHRIDLATGDELQDLAGAFNVMAGNVASSHIELESRISERTAQLQNAVDDARDKATRLYVYSRDLATISRLSTKVFNASVTQDEMLDRFISGITGGLGYQRVMLCLVDRKRIWLDVVRDTGIRDLISFDSRSLVGTDLIVQIVRSGKLRVISEQHDAFELYRTGSPVPRIYIIPLLSRKQTKKCWQVNSCIKTDCPAYETQTTPCWLLPNTLCGNMFIESYGNKLAYCMTCKVFPVLGVLVVADDGLRKQSRSRSTGVLRILAAEMAAALDNRRLYEENQMMMRNLLELHRVTALALTELSIRRALEVFTESALKFSGVDACSCWLLSKDGGFLDLMASGGVDSDDGLAGWPVRLPLDQGIIGRSLSRNGFILDYDIPHTEATELAPALISRGLNAMIAIPLKQEEIPRGVFVVHKRGDTPFMDNEIASFMLLANQTAMALNVCYLNEELKNQNVKLVQHTGLLSGILGSMSSGVMLLDQNSTVVLVNVVGASILRIRRDDLMNRRLTDLFPEAGVFVQQLTGPYQEIEMRLADGSVVPIGFTSTYYQGVAGEHEGVIVVFRDLTEIKSLHAELINKERFAAMGRVVAGVAHEIRNPLFGISSVGQILERELTNDAHLELVRALLSETRRMNQLVEELLQYGKPMKLNLAWCDVTGLWEEVCSMHRDETAQKGIRLLGDLHAGSLRAYLDANQIRQVFLNLLRNAIDATPEGGEISVRLLLDNQHVVFKVSDTGIGIPPENMAKIFDLFFTTKPKGTGLGLAICRKIIQDHGGEIAVASKEGEGTSVTVKLPFHKTVEQQGALV